MHKFYLFEASASCYSLSSSDRRKEILGTPPTQKIRVSIQLLDSARDNFYADLIVPKSQLTYSESSPDGIRFTIVYSGMGHFSAAPIIGELMAYGSGSQPGVHGPPWWSTRFYLKICKESMLNNLLLLKLVYIHQGIVYDRETPGLPWEWNFSSHSHPIPI